MVGALAANVGLSLLGFAVNFLIQPSFDGPWRIVESLSWMSTTLAIAVSFFQLAAAVEEKTLPTLAAATWVLSSFFDIGGIVVEKIGFGSWNTLFFDADLLLSLAVRGLLLAVLIRVTMQTRAWVVPLLAVVAVLTLLRTGLSVALTHSDSVRELYHHPLFRFGTIGATLFNSVAVLIAAWAMREVFKSVTATPAGAAAGLVPGAPEPINPAADFVVGGILLVVGIGVTVVSMSVSSNGGRYVVATGAIGVGLGRLIRGFIRLGKR
jgi:hypothetical protein